MKTYILIFDTESEGEINLKELCAKLEGKEFRSISHAYTEIPSSYDVYTLSDFIECVNNGELDVLINSLITSITTLT